MSSVDVARAEIFERFQRDDGGKFWVERYPWIVSYSGGKDSTLLLLLVCEALERFGSLRPVYVIFSDTGIEQDGIVERVRRNFDGLELWAKERGLDVRTAIISPAVEDRFFNHIVGIGYPAPQPPRLRWCVDRLKLKPISKWMRSTFKGGDSVTLTGERFEESAKRKSSMTTRLDDTGYYANETARAHKYAPIRDVKTRDLWEYLGARRYPWGEAPWTLLRQYKALSIAEVLDEKKERRSGCRFCTFSSCRKGASQIEEENLFCRKFAEYSERRVEARHIINAKLLESHYNTRKSMKRNKAVLSGECAIGLMTLEARRVVLGMVREMETATGRVWIGDEDLAFIERQWEIDAERIRRGELVDARDVLKTTL